MCYEKGLIKVVDPKVGVSKCLKLCIQIATVDRRWLTIRVIGFFPIDLCASEYSRVTTLFTHCSVTRWITRYQSLICQWWLMLFCTSWGCNILKHRKLRQVKHTKYFIKMWRCPFAGSWYMRFLVQVIEVAASIYTQCKSVMIYCPTVKGVNLLLWSEAHYLYHIKKKSGFKQ